MGIVPDANNTGLTQHAVHYAIFAGHRGCMRDGSTREVKAGGGNTVFSEFLARYQPTIVILSGGAKGTEFRLDQPRTSLGRGPGVDIALDDDSMSREHAAVEFAKRGFRLRDLDSTNGTLLNGGECKQGELKHGDKFQIGDHLFQVIFEERENTPVTFLLGDEG